MNSNQLGIAVAFAISLFGSAAFAEDGVSSNKILFGQVAALTGPAQDLGQGMRQGILAAFDDANRHGGIAGRSLELKSVDDGYEPEKTVAATKEIIDEDKAFAMIGAVGTPTSKASQPIATDAKVPFIGPFTGAEFLRNPYIATSSMCARLISKKPRLGSNT
jgi:branched-chain amino acid transport system substrate-binding protein